MEITEKEIEALRAYFDETNIDMTRLIRKIGLSNVKTFESFVEKLYELKKVNNNN